MLKDICFWYIIRSETFHLTHLRSTTGVPFNGVSVEWTPETGQNDLEWLEYLTGQAYPQQVLKGACRWESQEPLPVSSNEKLWKSFSVEQPDRPNLPGDIISSLLYHWKNQYARGKFNNEPVEEAALRDRISQLEQILGRLTLENAFLKKALENALKEQREKESSLISTRASSPVFTGGVS